jgi:hypothetical protein
LLLGSGGVDDVATDVTRNLAPAEAWCNRVAADLLMPPDEVERRYRPTVTAVEAAKTLSRYFKVSTLAVLVRLRSLGLIEEADFQNAYDIEARALATAEPKEPGGNYYNTFHSRMGSRFPEALTASVRTGATPRQRAFRLLGIKSAETYDRIVEQPDSSTAPTRSSVKSPMQATHYPTGLVTGATGSSHRDRTPRVP